MPGGEAGDLDRRLDPGAREALAGGLDRSREAPEPPLDLGEDEMAHPEGDSRRAARQAPALRRGRRRHERQSRRQQQTATPPGRPPRRH